MGMVRRSLIVLGTVATVLILSFVALFAAGGGGSPAQSGGFPAMPTTTTAGPGPTTTTSVVTVHLPGAGTRRMTLVSVTVPNVVGMTLAQADPALSVVGLAYEITHAPEPGGTSATGTIVAQSPDAGSQLERGSDIQVTVSGY